MGAWGIKNFENDYALDFCYKFELVKEKKIIIGAIKKIDNENDYLEAPECSEALCAIEMIAAKISNDYSSLPDNIGELLVEKKGLFKRSISFTSDEILISIRVLEKIIKDSELKELWLESDEFDKWLDNQNKLKKN